MKYIRILIVIWIGSFLISPSYAKPVIKNLKDGHSLVSSKDSHSSNNGDYILEPGDEVEITVYDNPDLSGVYPIGTHGFISFPLIGKVKVEGKTLARVEKEIQAKLANGYLINPSLRAKIVKFGSKKILIMGEVQKPGTYYLKQRTTLLEAIIMAGGATDRAAGTIYIAHPHAGEKVPRPIDPKEVKAKKDKNLEIVSLKALLEGNISKNIVLKKGDTIYLPPKQDFFVTGEVKNPGRYTLEDGLTVLKAITLAGGFTEVAAKGRVKIIRKINGERKVFKVKMDTLVKPGDTILVPESIF